jgi:hypothetical protein
VIEPVIHAFHLPEWTQTVVVSLLGLHHGKAEKAGPTTVERGEVKGPPPMSWRRALPADIDPG